MYPFIVGLFMFAGPLGSILIEGLSADGPVVWMALAGKWFVFWGVGLRLLTAGLRQMIQPSFTAEQIFGTKNPEVLHVITELGVANLAAGVVGVASLWFPGFVLPSALYGAIFYGVAGIRHIPAPDKSRNETIAMISDLFIFVVLTAFVVWAVAG
ncbi:MAG: hypothetical protein QM698_06120 [Micropepsaceae bacterium]